jgi:hypothetical protein
MSAALQLLSLDDRAPVFVKDQGSTMTSGGWGRRRLVSWGIDKLRLQHLIWFSSDQLWTSLDLLRGVMPDPAFFRAEDASYCQDEVPQMDVARLAEELRTLRGRAFPFQIESHPDLSVEEMVRYYGEAEYTRHDKLTCTTMENYALVDPRGAPLSVPHARHGQCLRVVVPGGLERRPVPRLPPADPPRAAPAALPPVPGLGAEIYSVHGGA